MKTINVCDATGDALDYLVAKAKDEPLEFDPMGFEKCSEGGWWIWDTRLGKLRGARYLKIGRHYSPRTLWEQGGPILEELRAMSHYQFLIENDGDNVHVLAWPSEDVFFRGYGPTLLDAVMRCYVAWRLGETVEIPNSLWPASNVETTRAAHEGGTVATGLVSG